MRIKTFIADTIAEAMAEVRVDLGDNAIIIATKEGKRGQRCEVRAAVEAGPDPIDSSAFLLEDKLRTRLFAEMEHELQGLKGLRNEMRDQTPPEPNYSEADLVRVLKYHRFAPTAAKQVFNAAKTSPGANIGDAFGNALSEILPVDPLPVLPQKPIMLVGPSGMGKTVAAAKLIARCLVKGSSVNCLTTDTLKAGAIAQLDHFCGLLGQTLTPCETPVDVVRNMAPGACIIDSPGVNPYRPTELRDLDLFIKAANAEPVLVLAAGQDAEELTEIARTFTKLGVRRAILTRLDTVQRLGSLFSATLGAQISIAHTGLSPYVADGFKPLSHSDLGHLLTNDPSLPGIEYPSVPKERAAS